MKGIVFERSCAGCVCVGGIIVFLSCFCVLQGKRMKSAITKVGDKLAAARAPQDEEMAELEKMLTLAQKNLKVRFLFESIC
jgi:hypothetical protein